MKEFIAKRFIAFGVADSESEITELVEIAKESSRIFYDEENKSFVLGFGEGAIFQNISTVANMVKAGIEDEMIIGITSISEDYLREIKKSTLCQS